MNIKYWEQIKKAAEQNKLDPVLVAAIVATESNFDTFAARYEPSFKYMPILAYKFAELSGITQKTEEFFQKCSFGLMQVMGLVAREVGYSRSLLQLTIPENGLMIGCKKLSLIYQKYQDESKAILAYNGGSLRINSSGTYSNQIYLEKVLANKKLIIYNLSSVDKKSNV
jgi:soluble lytic murein transglycosylase-like protein